MSEHDPSKREFINLPPLEIFKEDMREVAVYFELTERFSKYMHDEFGIPEVANDGGGWTVDRILNDPTVKEFVPTIELFETNPDLAIEKMRLLLLRVAYPLAENFIEDDAQFTDWVIRAAQVAIYGGRSTHGAEKCLGGLPVSTGSPIGCENSTECPVMYAKVLLAGDSIHIKLDSPDYWPEWRDKKISRHLAKLDAALAIGLTDEVEDEIFRANYLKACRALETTRKNSE